MVTQDARTRRRGAGSKRCLWRLNGIGISLMVTTFDEEGLNGPDSDEDGVWVDHDVDSGDVSGAVRPTDATGGW